MIPARSTSRAASSSRGSSGRSPIATAPIVVYCASGTRSLFAARTPRRARLHERALARRRLHRLEARRARRGSSPLALRRRSGGALLAPHDAARGRRRRSAQAARRPRSLCIGAGGLGSPSSMYLAAAGIGTHRHDRRRRRRRVEPAAPDPARHRSRRHAQGRERRADAARPQPRRAGRQAPHPDHRRRTRSSCSRATTSIIDGADNFATRYLVNDAALRLGKPVVHASIFRFEGQLTVFPADGGPCYRCLYPQPPPPEEAPSCAEAGVLGVLPGVMGVLQATEAIKLVLGLGDTLAGPPARLRRAQDPVPRAQAAPRSELPDLRRRRRSHGDPAHRLRAVLRRSEPAALSVTGLALSSTIAA